ncbi:MAG: formate dehydrogenase accessory sulfurtransferase FdhD [Gammaproteobacteria bacterium]|nr:formate dehydrogenase accessory sulfurtransferase FdhD [Gammaproteobacteria bacterium]
MPNSIPLVDEVPLAISINSINYSVVLVSPFDLEDFIVGYLRSESVITFNHDIHDIEFNEQNDALLANVTIANRCLVNFNAQQRQLKGTTGCGLCGTQALKFAFPKLTSLPEAPCFDLTLIEQTKSQLRQWQTNGAESGALHAAFWINSQGAIIACREDIGRHNALDKLLGYLLRQNVNTKGGAVLVTSRCSVELVQKNIIAGINNLISLASPSRLAAKMASQHNLHLIHVPKKDPAYLIGGIS